MFPTAAISAYLHAQKSNVNFKIGWTMLGWGTAGALVGSYFSGDIPDNNYNTLIGSVIVVLTVLMIIKKRKPTDTISELNTNQTKRFWQASFFGIFSGVLSGLIGTSGTTAIIAGLTLLGCTTMQTVWTSVFVLADISLVGFLMRAGVGTVNWLLAGVFRSSNIRRILRHIFINQICFAKEKLSKQWFDRCFDHCWQYGDGNCSAIQISHAAHFTL